MDLDLNHQCSLFSNTASETIVKIAMTHRKLARVWFELGQNIEEYNPTLEGMPNKNLAMRAYNFYLKFASIEDAVSAVTFPVVTNSGFEPNYIKTIGDLFGEREAKQLERSFNG